MPDGFGGVHLECLRADARRLAARLAFEERQVESLARAMDGDPAVSGICAPAARERRAAAESTRAALDALRVSARESRQAADDLVARLSSGEAVLDRPVLVADDAPDTVETIAALLELAGLPCLTAANGLEALVAAHVTRPALILMDINMPVLSGLEAARLLKASDATRGISIIAHTAKADFHSEPFAHLFAHVLAKPAPPDALLATIERFA
jgi:CheY-like chemotaxis protein